jgi:hypothetical protein
LLLRAAESSLSPAPAESVEFPGKQCVGAVSKPLHVLMRVQFV